MAIEQSELVNEIKATLQEITDVDIHCKVKSEKDSEVPHLVTVVKFEYVGRPSAMEPILELAAKGKPIHVKFYTPQLPLNLE